MPVAWLRGFRYCGSPSEPDEYVEECCPGEDCPTDGNDGWVPLVPKARYDELAARIAGFEAAKKEFDARFRRGMMVLLAASNVEDCRTFARAALNAYESGEVARSALETK